MGYYIDGPTRGKALWLIKTHNAEVIPTSIWTVHWDHIPKDKALVCVVENGMFDGAGYCYDARELERFRQGLDGRPATWLLMDKESAEKLSGFKK